jgi:hypothetical protein
MDKRTPQHEPIDPKDMDPRKKTRREQGLAPDEQHSRTPETEPEKDKRIDDL